MSYQHVCEPCRSALGLPAEKSYLNRMKRKMGGFSASGKTSWQPPLVFQRDPSGKPLIIGYHLTDHSVMTPTRCVCSCASNGHNPNACTGEDDFVIGGRPGSGVVDAEAAKFGMERTPEMVASLHEEVAAIVRVVVAWLNGETDEERIRIE